MCNDRDHRCIETVAVPIATHQSREGLFVERIPILPAALATLVGRLRTTHQLITQRTINRRRWRLLWYADICDMVSSQHEDRCEESLLPINGLMRVPSETLKVG
jgi:hypothetical protein